MKRLAVVLTAVAMLAVGCGDDGGGGGGGGGESGPTTLKIGLIPIADVAPVYLGQKKGFFKEQDITLEPQLAAGGAAITPAVLSGDYDIGFSNTISLLIAASKDLPVQIVSQGVLGGPDESKPWADLLVPKDSPAAKDLKALEGKTIAANTLNNICGVTINNTLEQEGVDVSKIKYTEVPFPEMTAALEKGRVDAACGIEPFVSQAKGAGMVGVAPFYARTAPDLTVATYFASKQYIAENGDVVDRFVEAMNKSLQYANDNPEEVRDVLTEYTEIPPEAAEKINLPSWKPELTTDTIQTLSELSEKYGYIEEQPDLEELIRK